MLELIPLTDSSDIEVKKIHWLSRGYTIYLEIFLEECVYIFYVAYIFFFMLQLLTVFLSGLCMRYMLFYTDHCICLK